MIELNCTYEESKKIFELGYDFAKVCWHSSYVYRDQLDYGKTFTRTHVHGTRLSLEAIRDRVKCEVDKYGIVGEVTPIIPKDALEKCLPDYLYVKDFYGELDRSRFVKKLCNEMIYLNSQDSETVSHEWFRTEYEAFIWCHENYPEELKKKFEGVMG